jgi:general secretion pathway protein C
MLKLLMRTHFWSFQLIFLLCCSYLLASITGQAVRAALPTPIPFSLATQERADMGTSLAFQKANYRSAVNNKANLFDPNQKIVAPTEDPQKKAKEAAEKEAARKKEAAASPTCPPNAKFLESKTLPLELKGTVVGRESELSVAAIFDAMAKETKVLRIGEIYKGILVCAIEPRYLKVDRGGGRFEFLVLGKKPGKLGKSDNFFAQYSKLRNTNLDTSKIQRTKDGRYQVPRDFISQITERMDIIASQAAIVPFFEKGQPVGFRIYHIRPGSLYDKIGIKNGDVIRQINGYKFNNPQKALEAYSNLVSATSLNVDIQRGSNAVNMRYEIKD